MHTHIMEELKKGAKSDKDVERALKAAFDKIESEWLEVSKGGFKSGFPHAAYVSTTAIVTLVQGNKVYVANTGDSSAYLTKVTDSKDIEFKLLNKIHDANNPVEQERLRRDFPKDKDILVCDLNKKNKNECWLKGGQ